MKRLNIFVFIFIVSFKMNAQQIVFGSGFNEERLKMRVKQIDEFKARFNYKQDIEGQKIQDSTNIEMRKKYIFSLFDENIVSPAIWNDSIENLYNDFLDIVVNEKKPIYIRFTDKNWIAQAECNVTLNGRPEKIIISLQVEKIRQYEYKWVIVGAKGSILALPPTNEKNPGIMISPIDNELRFMSLRNISDNNNNKDIIHYSYTDYEPDQITVLNTLIYTGQLKIQNVQRVVYYFFQVPGFVFRVEHFERDSDNVGWLIAEIIKVSNWTKNQFKHKLIN